MNSIGMGGNSAEGPDGTLDVDEALLAFELLELETESEVELLQPNRLRARPTQATDHSVEAVVE